MNFEQILTEVQIVAVRSRGPGGQNVNKVSSAAQLFWDYRNSQGVSDEEKSRIAAKLGGFINSEGFVSLRSDEFRDLPKNKSRCFEKLKNLLTDAFHQKKKRRATRPTHSSKIRKRESKTRRSEVKKSRQKVW